METEGQTLQEIAAAVGRIDNGAYGRCERCGVEIGRDRLQALPYVRHCIACARTVQQGEVTPARTTGA
jgi:RNA polymerase-binding transcription factor DksA